MQEQGSQELLARLRKIEGQIRGIAKLVEEEKDCEAILQQISASRAALYKVGVMYIAMHLRECLMKDVADLRKVENSLSRIYEILCKFT